MSEWQISQWVLVHAVHDTFFIGAHRHVGEFSASRVFPDATHESGLGHEHVPAPAEGALSVGHATLELAQAAVATRIAELDAELAAAVEVAS